MAFVLMLLMMVLVVAYSRVFGTKDLA